MQLVNRLLLVSALVLLMPAAAVHAAPAPFDLPGPKLEATVTRNGATLPVNAVPSLSAGDRLWIKADLPKSQSERYLLVVAFLRGPTNPPPPDWLTRCETWAEPCARAGLTVTVPDEAEQALIFMAPRTGGDYRTVVDAVRGRPGAFVRSAQDLMQASLDRSRLDAYLASVRSLSDSDPATLREAAPLLARSLSIKVDDKCLERVPELQAACLTQQREALLLDDGRNPSVVGALTSGPASDLAMAASATPQLSYGYYSPYIASVIDIARIFDSFHEARYQYIPALTASDQDRMALVLNSPPSFHDPKSVLVAALPPISSNQPPLLRAVNPKDLYCLRKSSLVLPVEGAPLVFSTAYARGMTLSLSTDDGRSYELPAKADAERGGFVVDTGALGSAALADTVRGTLQGYWGFDRYRGPTFQLVNARARSWSLADGDAAALVVGREDTIRLRSGSVACIERIMAQDPSGRELTADWKLTKSDEVQVKLPLQEAAPGPLKLIVTQYGAGADHPLELHTFAEAGHLDVFSVHLADTHGTLKGSRLDQVASLTLKGATFLPAALTSAAGHDELAMVAQDAALAAEASKTADAGRGEVTLRDGRKLAVKIAIEPPRPVAALIGKSVQPSSSSSASHISLGSSDELPQDAILTFSLRARTPARFPRDMSVEIATVDEAFSTTVSLKSGGMTWSDASVALVTLDPEHAFGPAAFGALRFRVITREGAGDWQPLTTLVRLPSLKELKCPPEADESCLLSGSNLFLVDEIAGDPQFEHAVRVADGFPGSAITVPRPTDGKLYLKLRDDPTAAHPALLNVPM